MIHKLCLFAFAAALSLTACMPVEPAEEILPTPEFTERITASAIAPERIVRTQQATLSAIGDVLIHGTVYDDARTETGYDFYPMFGPVESFLSQSEITFANSESIIGGSEIGVSTYPSFNSPFEVGDAMKKAGVDIVSMSNNHTLDRGVRAIENAHAHWDSLDIVTSGSALSEEQRMEVPTIERNGITFSFLSYTYATNGVPTPSGRSYLVDRIDLDLIKSDLARATQQSDVAVVSFHFGVEYESMPSLEQIELAHFAAEHGADIILGHHPHVLQPPAWIETSDGRRSFVIYSLGNFLSGQQGVERQIGGIVHMEAELTETAEGSSVTIANPRFTPTFTYSANYRDFKVVLLKDVNEQWNENTKIHMKTWMPELEFHE